MSVGPPEPVKWAGRRALRIPLLVAGVGVAFVLSRQWPVDQSVHIVLGDAAAGVSELRLRYAEPEGGRDDWQREASFHFERGRAPRVVTHEPHIANGVYDVEIELTMATGAAEARTVTETRRVTLTGRPASIDVSRRALAGGESP